MGVTVYQFEHSPYCIPITRALEALGVAFAVHNVSNADRSEIIRLTDGKYYQVPVLGHDGKIIYESSPVSTDVAHYVDATFAKGRLFPAAHEGLQRIVVDHLENEVEGVTFRLVDPPYLRSITDPAERVMIVRHKERKFGAGCVEAWAAQRAELSEAAKTLLEPYDLTLRHSPFLFGETPVYADFALFGILGNLTYRDYNPLPNGLDALGQWFARMQTFRFA
ncbi:MAG: glutathione S-transferase family protein [Terrimicrobiaceae bacterium]